MKANPNRQSLIWIFSFLFISSIMVYSTGYNDPLIASQVCLINGNCTLADVIVDDLLINGNLTFIGQVYNLTVINQNVSGTLDIEGNLTTDCINGAYYYWNDSNSELTIGKCEGTEAIEINWTGNHIFVDNVTANWFFGNYNWSIAGVPSSNYLSFDGSILTFSETNLNATIEAHLASTTFYPTKNVTVYGTDSGGNNIGNLSFDDGQTFNITEANGANALLFYVNFTDVTEIPDYVCMGHRYIGTHNIELDVWDYDTSSWENYDTITSTSSITKDCKNLVDGSDHVQNNIVQVRFIHPSNGVATHKLLIDFVNIVHGFGVTSTEESDPFFNIEGIKKDGTTTTTAEIPFAQGIKTTNITADNGPLEFFGNITATGTIQAEHLKTTDDLEVADDILLGSQSVINFNSGDVTITHDVNKLTLAGGTLYANSGLSVTGTTNFWSYITGDGGMEMTGASYFYDSVDVEGKLNANGGIDPPYVLIDLQTKEQIVMRTRQEIPFSKAGGRAYVNIISEPRIKWFIPLTCEFYGEKIDRDGWIVPTVIDTWNDGKVCYNTNSTQRYYYDRITDTIKISETTIYNNSFPEDKVLNRETGVIEDKPILIGGRT